MRPTWIVLAFFIAAPLLDAQDATEKTSRGWHYYERGKYDQARKNFREALRKNADDTEAIAGIAWCLFRSGKLADAKREFQEILEKDPSSVLAMQGLAAITQQEWATLTLGDSLTSQGYFEQALLLYDRILRKKDRDYPVAEIWRARLGKAWCLYWKGDYSAAKENFEGVLREREHEPTALQGLGYTHYQRGKFELAREQLEKALVTSPQWFAVIDNLGWCEFKIGNYGKAIAFFKEAIRLSPSTVDSHAGAAWVRQKGGRTEQALEYFRSAIALDPRYVETDDFRKLVTKDRAYRELLLPLGEAYVALGEYRIAIPRLKRALYSEDTLRVRSNLGYAQLQIGHYMEAITTLQMLPPTAPQAEEIAWKNGTSTLGWSHYYAGDHKEAAKIFQRIGATAEIGWCLLQQNKLAEAEKIFVQVLEDTPKNTLASSGLSRIHGVRRATLDQGWVEFYAGQYNQALTTFAKALSANLPSECVWEAKLGLGWCHIRKEAYDDAAKELQDARYEALNATTPLTARATVQIGIGWTLFGKENYTPAVEAFENARETFPEYIDIYRGLGWSYLRMGRTEEALHAFQKGLEISPRDPSCTEGITLLQSDTKDK